LTPTFSISLLVEDFIGEANGVCTAFVAAKEALKKEEGITIHLNTRYKQSDLIHAHSIGLKYLWVSYFHKKKLIVSAHVVPGSFIGSLIFSRLWQPVATSYLKWVFSRASLVIAVSSVVKEELQSIGVNTRIEVLCNSVDRERFKKDPNARLSIRRKLGLKDDDFVAICVGQIQPRKGIYDFLDTAKNCPDITFVWVGGRPYGRLTADYHRLTKVCDHAPKNVIFTGTIDYEEMPAYYSMADVYFLPSFQENFSFATIEASACELPLILRDNVEYPRTLFTHYLMGNNSDAFSRLIKILHSSEKELKIAQKESAALASRYELKTYIRELIGFYREFIN